MRGAGPAALAAACLFLAACAAGDPAASPQTGQPGLLKESARQPAERAARTLEAMKNDPEALLRLCLESYQAAQASGPEWHLVKPAKVGMTSLSSAATDPALRRDNPDGWVDRGELRSEIMDADDDPATARCLLCRFDFEDNRSDPLTLFGVDTTGRCS
ncbi:hypothetical protein [Geminicoccus roseus]|uniref:hypothetical protein n=1 Tax=Geminicoccus roseus TaxID=404900 RepID=UPI000416BAC8|nr:hypothetical protein [Geminicoccus roseus]